MAKSPRAKSPSDAPPQDEPDDVSPETSRGQPAQDRCPYCRCHRVVELRSDDRAGVTFVRMRCNSASCRRVFVQKRSVSAAVDARS